MPLRDLALALSALFLAMALSACSKAGGPGLVFEAKELFFPAEEGQTQLEATFHFVNRSDKPIRIQGTETSCGCLRAEPDKTTYQPGEEGTIVAGFDFSGKSGEVENWVNVHTDVEGLPIRLVIHVDIPRVIEFTPTIATWAIGEAPTPKRVQFKVLREKPIHIQNMELLRQGMSVNLITVEAGRHYEIELTPQSTAEPMVSAISILTDCEIPTLQRQTIFFQIDTQENLDAEQNNG